MKNDESLSYSHDILELVVDKSALSSILPQMCRFHIRNVTVASEKYLFGDPFYR